MNVPATKPALSTFLQKARERSAVKKEETSLTLSQNNPRVQAILAAHPLVPEVGQYTLPDTTFYHQEFNTETAMQLARPDVELGSFTSFAPEENPTLIDFKLAYNERRTVTWMLPHVSSMNAASSASNRMDEADIILCCRNIITAFPWLTLAEFSVFCVRMIQHRYVKKRSDYVFGLDTIMQGLHEFQKERIDEIAKYEREHKPEPDYSDAVTYEEYCRLVGKDITVDPITGLAKHLKYRASQPRHTQAEIDAYMEQHRKEQNQK